MALRGRNTFNTGHVDAQNNYVHIIHEVLGNVFDFGQVSLTVIQGIQEVLDLQNIGFPDLDSGICREV